MFLHLRLVKPTPVSAALSRCSRRSQPGQGAVAVQGLGPGIDQLGDEGERLAIDERMTVFASPRPGLYPLQLFISVSPLLNLTDGPGYGRFGFGFVQLRLGFRRSRFGPGRFGF